MALDSTNHSPCFLLSRGLLFLLVMLWATSCTKEAISSEGNRAARPAGGSSTTSARGGSLPQLAGPHHPVFSLTDNRLLAHLVRDGGLFIHLGHPGMAKYATFRRPWKPWTLNAKEDGRPVALASRSVTWLVMPLTAEQTQATLLTLSLKSPKPQGLVLTLNKTRLKPLRLGSGWEKVSVQIPPRTLQAGENRLELSWGATGQFGGKKASAAVEWLHLGKQELTPTAPLWPLENDQLVLPKGGGLAYYIHPYKGAKLQLGLASEAASRGCDLTVRLLLQGKQQPVVTTLATGQPQHAGAQTYVDLAPVAGQVARLELLSTGEACTALYLKDAAIVMPGPAPTVKRGPKPKNIIFWLIDNVRADRFDAYNPKTRVKTPVASELARTGTVFRNAYIQGTESRVSHAAIWTGLYPKQHRFVDPKARLSLSWDTLPEQLRSAGYTTAAWIANGFVSKFWGFGEGWDVFRNHLHQGGGLSAAALADRAIEFIQKHHGPYYIYVGTIDVHVSWRGQQPWLDQYHPEPYQGPYRKVVFGKDVEKMASGRKETSPADRKRIIAIYDSTVSFNDHHLGRLLKAIEERGERDQTMVIITADHGEELWDFGRIGHGSSLREPLVAVPLIIHYPPLFGSGVVVQQGVDVLSVMPSILDAAGAKIPEVVQGESLLPLAQGVGTGYPRPSLASQYELAHAMRLERWKVWVGGKGEPRLYDLASAKGEHQEVADQHPLALRWLTDSLSTFLIYQSRWRNSRWGVSSNHKAALAKDLEKGPPPSHIKPER